MALTFPVKIRCDVTGCRSSGTARGHLTNYKCHLPTGQETRAVLVVYPKGWKHAPVVDFCPKCLRKRAAHYAKRKEKDPLPWE